MLFQIDKYGMACIDTQGISIPYTWYRHSTNPFLILSCIHSMSEHSIILNHPNTFVSVYKNDRKHILWLCMYEWMHYPAAHIILNAADSYLLKQNEIFIGKINFLQFKTRKISISSIVISSSEQWSWYMIASKIYNLQ